jgi:hypothetical protein
MFDRLPKLSIDDKWDIAYDHSDNDRPKAWYRYGEFHSEWDENNATTAMFYRLLGVCHYGETA